MAQKPAIRCRLARPVRSFKFESTTPAWTLISLIKVFLNLHNQFVDMCSILESFRVKSSRLTVFPEGSSVPPQKRGPVAAVRDRNSWIAHEAHRAEL